MDELRHRQLINELKKFYQDLWAPYEATQPKHLYHYTSLDGLRGIARTALLWASDIAHMSTDTNDGKYMLEVIRPVVNGAQVPFVFKRLFESDEALLQLGKEWFLYIACFSTTSTIESQWQEYAASCTGCAIELDYDSLFAACNGGKEYALCKVLYNRNDQELFVSKTINNALRVRREWSRSEADDRAFWFELLLVLILCGVRFKHSSYASEDEWRVLIMDPDRRSAKLRLGMNGKDIWYRPVFVGQGIVQRILRGSACDRTASQLEADLTNAAFEGVPVHDCAIKS